IIMQKYYYGLRSDEIAKIVGLRSSTVRSRLTRAMKRLRGMLREEDFR
ncbi:MAG: RNA polymerase subunit sigma-24, partial [Oscillospiraceae bacterium]|nr:RNA polymerase subunit sigma-24 [Oscillospiraceae bacterium]